MTQKSLAQSLSKTAYGSSPSTSGTGTPAMESATSLNKPSKRLTPKEQGKLNEAMIPIEYLRTQLSYDPETGILRWLVTRGPAKKGREAGWLDKTNGYRSIKINRHPLKAHRIAWALHTGAWPTDEIDHIEGIRDDNRIEKLRDSSRPENSKNMARPFNNISGVIGVSWDNKAQRWISTIMVNFTNINLGRFHSFEEAVAARQAAEIKYGFHENHGRDAIVDLAQPTLALSLHNEIFAKK